MQSLGIVLLCVIAAVLYGVTHDQITARVCVEYFTIGHPPMFGTDNPTLLGLGWGVCATWWVGLLLGVPLAVAARIGSRSDRWSDRWRTCSRLQRFVLLGLVLRGGCWRRAAQYFWWARSLTKFRRTDIYHSSRICGRTRPAISLG